MSLTQRPPMSGPMCLLVFLLCPIGPAIADDAKVSYPTEAPIERYRMADAAAEIALARSAAPASISADATILALGEHGYDTAIQGKNGFVCVVERAWANTFDEPGFWNPKVRAPICFNGPAARSVLPAYLERTQWVLAGVSKADMIARSETQRAAKPLAVPEPGSMSFMMSKQGYLGDGAGHWHPHLMFFAAQDAAAWGADLEGSPVFSSQVAEDTFRTFYVRVPAWSDGTSEPANKP